MSLGQEEFDQLFAQKHLDWRDLERVERSIRLNLPFDRHATLRSDHSLGGDLMVELRLFDVCSPFFRRWHADYIWRVGPQQIQLEVIEFIERGIIHVARTGIIVNGKAIAKMEDFGG